MTETIDRSRDERSFANLGYRCVCGDAVEIHPHEGGTCPSCGRHVRNLLDPVLCRNYPEPMKIKPSSQFVAVLFFGTVLTLAPGFALRADEPAAKRAFIDGVGPGWVALGEKDFVKVNCDDDTWTFPDGEIHCTGQPIGVTRSAKEYTNFELVVEWMHLNHAGNSGLFIWTMPKAIEALEGPGLPRGGIEVQVLDLGYAEDFRKKNGKESDWFTSHGDIFPVGESKLKPFPPLSANGSRSFPSKNLSKGVGEWNHYYVRAINGEVRLWVNGEEVSGGSNAVPATGYLCLESEGSPIKFKNLRIRELP